MPIVFRIFTTSFFHIKTLTSNYFTIWSFNHNPENFSLICTGSNCTYNNLSSHQACKTSKCLKQGVFHSFTYEILGYKKVKLSFIRSYWFFIVNKSVLLDTSTYYMRGYKVIFMNLQKTWKNFFSLKLIYLKSSNSI